MILASNPAAQYESHREAILAAVARVLERNQYILGPEVRAFERAFAAYIGVEHAVGVGSGTDALVLALRALDIGPGDEVVTVSHTALATVAAVIATGATPVLVDVEPRCYTVDPAGIEAAITRKTKGIIPVHLYGQSVDMDAVARIARAHGLTVIEDCAQAVGATHRGRRLGSIGDVGCFSFYPTKNLGAVGDAGAVVTRRTDVAERLARIRQYGWNEARRTQEPGANSRLDEIQAAILGVKLPTLDADNARRRQIARHYTEAFDDLPIVLPASRADAEHVYHLYVIACERPEQRESLRQALAADGIMAGVHYPVPAHLHDGYRERCRIPAAGLPVTETLARTVLTLPMYPELSDADLAHVVRSVRWALSAIETGVGR